jgi:type IV secretion system protein TrbF
MLFRRPSVRYNPPSVAETPFQRAGQLWDERLGAARVQAHHWRLLAFGELGLVFVLTFLVIWLSARSTVTPWVVQVDKIGEAKAIAPATADYQPTDHEIAWYLARFIEYVRSLPMDPVVVRDNWYRAYDFLTDRGRAALSEYARANDPFSEIGKIEVAVEISSVIRASPNSFRVAWTEQHYENGSRAGPPERWTAILTVAVETPTTAERLLKNPLGVYIHALNWSKELDH